MPFRDSFTISKATMSSVAIFLVSCSNYSTELVHGRISSNPESCDVTQFVNAIESNLSSFGFNTSREYVEVGLKRIESTLATDLDFTSDFPCEYSVGAVAPMEFTNGDVQSEILFVARVSRQHICLNHGDWRGAVASFDSLTLQTFDYLSGRPIEHHPLCFDKIIMQ